MSDRSTSSTGPTRELRDDMDAVAKAILAAGLLALMIVAFATL